MMEMGTDTLLLIIGERFEDLETERDRIEILANTTMRRLEKALKENEELRQSVEDREAIILRLEKEIVILSNEK
ncbi:MAG TPA: hypothetical protein VHZ76_00760 [Gammaproteobacteria bacterium]|jgi:hypothetical protein|nr:hypothetical protein [Gammaproteobacteria bacterium]